MKRKQFFALVVSLCSLFTMNTAIGQTEGTVNMRVVFPMEVSNVRLHLWEPYSSTFIMNATGENEFSAEVSGIFNPMLFNVEFDMPAHFITSWWIGGGNTYVGNLIPERFDAHGLKYGKLYINNQLLDNRYAVVNSSGNGLNISVKINDNNTISPNIEPSFDSLLIDDRIPSEAHHHKAYLNTSLPQPKHVKIGGWATAITDNNILNESQIEIDYIRVYGRENNQLTLLKEKDYSTYDPENDGGLYYRYPFFPSSHDWHDPMPGSVSNGILTLHTSQNRMKVWHWWSHNFTSPSGFDYDSYKVVCKMRITGHALVQVGIDFRDQWDNVDELGVSDWHFHNNGEWQEVVFDSQDFFSSDIQIEIPLNNVWNAVSSYINPTNPELSSILGQLGDDFIIFQNLDSVYYPAGGVIELSTWDYQSGYLIKMNEEATLTLTGSYPENRILEVKSGWNIIPVLSVEPQQIQQLFATNMDNIIIIKEIIGTKVFWPAYNINGLDELSPNKSYLIKSNATFSVTFD